MTRERRWWKGAERAVLMGQPLLVTHPSNRATGMGAKVVVPSEKDMLEMLGADNKRVVINPEETASKERVQEKD